MWITDIFYAWQEKRQSRQLKKLIDDNEKRILASRTLEVPPLTPKEVQARAFAEKAHSGQKRKTGEDFMTHPLAVMDCVFMQHRIAYEDVPLYRKVALLHDVAEDTKYTVEDIRKEFGDEVADNVGHLTKGEKEEYHVYLNRILDQASEGNMVPVKIKIADLIHNISTWPDKGALRDKWWLALTLCWIYVRNPKLK